MPYLDQRFKMTFLAMEKEGKDENLEPNIIRRTLEKKEKTNLKWFLSSIMLEKKGTIVQYQRGDLEKTHTEALMTEFHIYSQIKEKVQWKTHYSVGKTTRRAFPSLHILRKDICALQPPVVPQNTFSAPLISLSVPGAYG